MCQYRNNLRPLRLLRFREAGHDTVVIYGWSVGDQDRHILNALVQGKPKEIAISIYRSTREKESYWERVADGIRDMPQMKDCKICFFDAESDGCWIYQKKDGGKLMSTPVARLASVPASTCLFLP